MLVKLGSRGSMLVTPDEVVTQDAIKTDNVVDTTGAGDAFTGTSPCHHHLSFSFFPFLSLSLRRLPHLYSLSRTLYF